MSSSNYSRSWRIMAILGVMVFGLITETLALSRRNDSLAIDEPALVNATDAFKDSGKVLAVPLRRVSQKGMATPSLAKRFFKSEVLGVFGAAYLAELTIGSTENGKKQVVDVLIDTGSFELWVDPVCSKSNVPDYCAAFGRYDPAQSSTSRKIDGRGFSIKYGSGQVAGDYYKDDIYISGAKIQGQQFGVANTSELVWFGIMGLARGWGTGSLSYPLVVDSLAAQGFTNTKLFSIDLGKQVNPGAITTGEIAFGGVDRNKYSGLLKKVPTDRLDPHYKITLNSLAHHAPGARSSTRLTDASLPLPVIVDSGTTLSLLPEVMVKWIAAQFPGAEPDGNGGYRVDCAFQRQQGTVDFEFLSTTGPVVINVAYSDFIWNNGGRCFLGASYSSDVGIWILGDSFLRGAYVAFDQTNDALFMSNYHSCGNGQSNLASVPAGPDAAGRIPGACPGGDPPHRPSWGPSDSHMPTTWPPTRPASASKTPPCSTHQSPHHMEPTKPGKPMSLTRVPRPSSSTPSPKSLVASNTPQNLEQQSVTITSTATRIVVYTATACPDSSAADCTDLGQPLTRFETIVTTFCPCHKTAVISTAPSAADEAGTTNTDIPTETIAATPSSTAHDDGNTITTIYVAPDFTPAPAPPPPPSPSPSSLSPSPSPSQPPSPIPADNKNANPTPNIPPTPTPSPNSSPSPADIVTTTIVRIQPQQPPNSLQTYPSTPSSGMPRNKTWTDEGQGHGQGQGQGQGPAIVAAAPSAKTQRVCLGVAFAVVWGVMWLL